MNTPARPLTLCDALAQFDHYDRALMLATVEFGANPELSHALADLLQAADHEVATRRDEQQAAKELAFRRAVSS